MTKRYGSPLAWGLLGLGMLYLLTPLFATFQFSTQMQAARGIPISFLAYNNVLTAPALADSFAFSLRTALITIAVSVLIVVPTAYWINLRMRFLRPVIEFLTLLPFVIPAVVLAFALIRSYNGTDLTNTRDGVYILMVGAYVMLSFPYMYRSVDTGLQALNIRALTEAAQSLGAGWGTILFRVVIPNLLVSILNGAFITFSIVIGEYTIASLLSQPGFGPYMFSVASRRVYEPSALAMLSFGLTFLTILLIQRLSRGRNVGTAVR